MDLKLGGKVAVVTGASRGIGLAVTRGLVEEGARVIAAARRTTADLDELAASGAVRVAELDLSDADAPGRLVSLAPDRLDIVVNNVGGAQPRPRGFLEISDDDWLASINLDLMAAVRTTRSAVARMLEAGTGSIVMVASVNAFLPDPMVMDYSAAKGALANFAKSLSKEVGPKGIRVNAVSPGPVATDLWLGADGVAARLAAASGARPSDIADNAAGQSVTGRFTRPEEVADLVLLLASDRTANVTGSTFTIDGGLTTTL
jgi:NAD(P)-dependent dehydrogenase (short-subunit alcohol dehydrogenase family)